MAHHGLLRAVLIKTNDLRRDAVQRFQGSFIVLPQLGILQTLQDAPFLRFIQQIVHADGSSQAVLRAEGIEQTDAVVTLSLIHI